MKSKIFFKVIFLFLVVSAIVKCGKDDDPGPFIDGYIPKITDTIGKVYEGNYLPVNDTVTWTYYDEITYNGKLNISTLTESYSIPQTIYKLPGSHTFTMDTAKIVNFTGDDLLVNPVEYDVMTMFFHKTDTSVAIPFYLLNDSLEKILENPYYIKNNLIVGDKWITEPVINFDLYLETITLNVTDFTVTDTKSYIYVLGNEAVSWSHIYDDELRTDTVQTIRLEHKAEISGIATIVEDSYPGTIEFKAKYTNNFNVKDGIGIIKEKLHMEIWGSGYYTVANDKVNISFNGIFDIESRLNESNLISSEY